MPILPVLVLLPDQIGSFLISEVQAPTAIFFVTNIYLTKKDIGWSLTMIIMSEYIVRERALMMPLKPGCSKKQKPAPVPVSIGERLGEIEVRAMALSESNRSLSHIADRLYAAAASRHLAPPPGPRVVVRDGDVFADPDEMIPPVTARTERGLAVPSGHRVEVIGDEVTAVDGW